MFPSPRGSDTALLAVRLLGGLQVWREGQLLPRPWPTRRTGSGPSAASLFAFLLLHPEREFDRQDLAGILWPGVDEQDSRRALSSALVPIRRLLEPLPEERGRFLVCRRHVLCLAPPRDWWVDVWAFERRLDEGVRAALESPEWFLAREEAVGLYVGDLLHGVEDGWCASRREELRARFLACLHDLMRSDEERGRYDRAAEWARRALGVDRCDQESHRVLMRLYAQQGKRAQAIQQYRDCQRALREERDAAPDAETVALYQSLRPPRKASKPPSSQREETADLELLGLLVGREQEQDRLQTAWERARAGRGELILLTGEAGIGKSRLGRQLLQRVALDGGLPLYGQASALEFGFLYRPLIDPLRRALELAAQHGLTLCAPLWLAQLAQLLPELRHGSESLSFSEGDRPRLLEQGIVQLFMRLAAQRPLCLFVDDLQWADPATGRVLSALCHQARQADLLAEPAHLLLIASVREEEVPDGHWLGPWLTELQGQRLAAALPLSRLEEEEVSRLLGQLAGGRAPETLLRPLSKRLHEETEGNPLFLLETVRDLFERGYLVVGPEGRWRLAAEPPGQPETAAAPRDLARETLLARRLPLPASVQRVVRLRVARLGAEERELLQCAAVIGRRFNFETVRRVVGPADGRPRGPAPVAGRSAAESAPPSPASPLPDVEPTLTLLERLLAAGLIRAQAHPAALDFSHDKIREVVYKDLTPLHRQQLHRRVGEALESIYGLTDEADRPEGPNPSWFRHAAPLPPRAEHAEELARHFHEAASRIGPEKAIRYHCLAGMRARALMDYEKAVHDLLVALSLLGELSLDVERLALWGQIVQQLAPAYRGTGHVEAAREAIQEYVALCERHRYVEGIVHGCVLLGQFLELNPRLVSPSIARAMHERAIAVCEAHGLRDWIVYPQSYLAFTLAARGGDLQQAEALARACLSRAAASQDRLVLQRAYISLMWIATRRADWEALKEVFQASLAAGGPYAFPLPSLLDEIEETCHRRGTEATFVALCRDMAESYARVGLTPPLSQWHLAPTTPGVAPSQLAIREEFDGQDWHSALEWQDATGRSRIDRATRPGWLGIDPPVDCDLWPEADLNAPRLMATVRGDFVAQTRVELSWDNFTYGGLLVWRDEQHFVRLELRTLWGERATVYLEACVAGRFQHVGRGHCERRPMWLRLERTGDGVRALCSAGGEQWLTCGAVRFPRGEAEQVGLAAITRTAGARVWFDTLLLWNGIASR